MAITLDNDIAARLAAFQIRIMAETPGHRLLVRDNCFALMRVAQGGGTIGSSGMMTEGGLAFLIWREGRAWLAAKGSEAPAGEEQVQAMLRFSADVKQALGS